MNIFINGQTTPISKEGFLAELLPEILAQATHNELTEKDSFAVALNFKCIPRSQFSKTKICENDQLEILTPMQGG